MTDKRKSLLRHLHKQDSYRMQTRVHPSPCAQILTDTTDTHTHTQAGLLLNEEPSEGWVCVAVRTHKLQKNVVYSFRWREFKLSSAGLRP